MIVDATGWQLEPTPWAARAACADQNTNQWFPTRGETVNQARAVCATCPVTVECLAYALRWDIRHGVWGGLSTRERRRLRTGRPRRMPAAHGTATRYARGCRCEECREANRGAAYWRDP